MRTCAVLFLWGGVFLILLLTLPRPSLLIQCDEPVHVQMITEDSSTLIALSVRGMEDFSIWNKVPTAPIRLLDLKTGQQRLVADPTDGEQAARVQEIAGEPYRVAGQYTHGVAEDQIPLSGDFLVLVVRSLDNSMPSEFLEVINWRTGERVHRRPYHGQYRFAGDRLLVEQTESGLQHLEIWNLRNQGVAKGSWMETFRGLDLVTVSRNGRWVLQRMSDRCRLWELETGTLKLEISGRAEAVAFSLDDTRLAIVGDWVLRRPSWYGRLWRLVDIESGAIVRADVEESTSSSTQTERLPSGPINLSFTDDGRTLQCRQEEQQQTDWELKEARDQDVPFIRRAVPDSRFVSRPAWKTLFERNRVVEWSHDEKWAVTSPSRRVQASRFASFVNALESVLCSIAGSKLNQSVPLELRSLPNGHFAASLGRTDSLRCWFTPDRTRVVTQLSRELRVWNVPPGRPWFKALLWSLLLPAAASLVACLRSRRSRVRAPAATDSRA